jgi:hypothetical protein
MGTQVSNDLALEAVINRVSTTLNYLWPGARVEVHQDRQCHTNTVQLTTYHAGTAWRTCVMLDAWRGRYDAGLYEHLMQALPVQHAVELARVACAQAEAERFTTHKSEGLRDYNSHPRPRN